MPFHMGPWEIGLILVIILIIFGVGKLPQVGGAIGRGLRSFRQAQRGEEDEEKGPKSKRRVTKKVAGNVANKTNEAAHSLRDKRSGKVPQALHKKEVKETL